MSTQTPNPTCAVCPIRDTLKRRCSTADGRNPANCPTVLKPELAAKALERYYEPENLHLARVAGCAADDGRSLQPDGSYRPDRTRIEELVHFCRELGCSKLGLLFCMGLASEAAIVEKILQTNGFTVISAICKVGSLPKAAVGLEDIRNEPACNPILQAELVNEAKVDFNIFMGLCIGHDTLLFKHVAAPVTVLAVKDRVLGHNPLAAIYNYDSYYTHLQRPLPAKKK